MESSEPAEYVTRFINQTNRAVFLTGKAGTGKTTLLKQIIESTHKKAVIVAPTGIAALNAGGVTIHSMFQLPFASFIPAFGVNPIVSNYVKFETKDSLVKHFKFSGKRKELLLTMELLIIDEVSMLRADVLDAIDWTLRSIRRINESFGGVQVLYIGDLLQLPPVVKHEEWSELRNYYAGVFFFHSQAVRENPPLYIELTKIYRQDDARFIDLLDHLRNNQIDNEDISLLDQYVQPNFDIKSNPGFITLTTHNSKADQLNAAALSEIKTKSYHYHVEIKGDFPNQLYPLDETLELKLNAQIMFIKNDLSVEKRYYNGKTGFIKSLSEHEIIVYFPDEKRSIEVEKNEWQNIRYSVNPSTKEIEEEVLGSFIHYPIKLAWAITVHKSQGLTFEKAVLDVSHVFAPGQAYVALSRLRSLDGLILLSPMKMNGLTNDPHVMQYAQTKSDHTQLAQVLKEETIHFLHKYLVNAYEWRDVDTFWRIHEASYVNSKSEKSGHKQWAVRNAKLFNELVAPSQKFIAQLDRLFNERPLNFGLIEDRVKAANSYFSPTLDALFKTILSKKDEVKHVKKIKLFFEELNDLEEYIFELVSNIKRSEILFVEIKNGKEVTRNKLWSTDLLTYRSNALAKVALEALPPSSLLDAFENEGMDRIAVNQNSPVNETKKSTYEKTLALIIEKKSISEIAAERVMSETTIVNHITSLLRQETITLDLILSKERISELDQLFSDYTEQSLTPLKEKVGESFSWDELKMYRASLIH